MEFYCFKKNGIMPYIHDVIYAGTVMISDFYYTVIVTKIIHVNVIIAITVNFYK